MAHIVKRNSSRDGSRRKAATRGTGGPKGGGKISSKHQVTIPQAAFKKAGLEVGDRLFAESHGKGQVVFTRVNEVLDHYSGGLNIRHSLRDEVEKLRNEWE